MRFHCFHRVGRVRFAFAFFFAKLRRMWLRAAIGEERSGLGDRARQGRVSATGAGSAGQIGCAGGFHYDCNIAREKGDGGSGQDGDC